MSILDLSLLRNVTVWWGQENHRAVCAFVEFPVCDSGQSRCVKVEALANNTFLYWSCTIWKDYWILSPKLETSCWLKWDLTSEKLWVVSFTSFTLITFPSIVLLIAVQCDHISGKLAAKFLCNWTRLGSAECFFLVSDTVLF